MNDTDQQPLSWVWGPFSQLGLSIALFAVLADQLHKWWMLAIFDIDVRGKVIVSSFFNLVYYSNKGISFSMLQTGEMGQYVLAGFAFAVSVVLLLWLARTGDSRLMAISVGLIVGGAVGNAIDRLHLGGVADFFEFHYAGYYWPAFNIADSAIVAGVAGLLYDLIVPSRNRAANGA
ncbi:MAG: signal peptidase II [Hyphomicrobiaceae bacterium]